MEYIKNKRFLVLNIIFILLWTIFSYFNTFSFFENKFYDGVFLKEKPIEENIIIIAIDDNSLEELGQWPFSRNLHGKLIDYIEKGKPKAVGIDIIFSENAKNPKEDIEFSKVLKKHKNIVMPSYGILEESSKRGINAKYISKPIDIFQENVMTGHINVVPDYSDGIVRRFPVEITSKDGNIKSFGQVVAEVYLNKKIKDIPRDKWDMSPIDFYGEPGSYEYLSYVDVLNEAIPYEYFEDKIILIGPYAIGIADDYYYTPMDRQKSMYGVEIHANIIQNMLENRFLKQVEDYKNIILVISFGIIASLVFKKGKLKVSFIIFLIIIGGYLKLAQVIYQRGFVIQIFYPLGIVITVYITSIINRYIEEYFEKKRVKNLFGKYVAPEVVDEILNKKDIVLGGEKREISVLFVDIRGFTPLSEKASPEEVVGILNEYLTLTSQSILKERGTLDKFIGDATMAIFNAPLDMEDHEYHAVKAAWHMKQGAEELGKRIEEKYGKVVKFGIGVNRGPAVVGNIGSENRMDYTAIGDTVNTAARLESNAKAGQILVSKEVFEKIEKRVKVKEAFKLKVKGKEEELDVYEIEEVY